MIELTAAVMIYMQTSLWRERGLEVVARCGAPVHAISPSSQSTLIGVDFSTPEKTRCAESILKR